MATTQRGSRPTLQQPQQLQPQQELAVPSNLSPGPPVLMSFWAWVRARDRNHDDLAGHGDSYHDKINGFVHQVLRDELGRRRGRTEKLSAHTTRLIEKHNGCKILNVKGRDSRAPPEEKRTNPVALSAAAEAARPRSRHVLETENLFAVLETENLFASRTPVFSREAMSRLRPVGHGE